MTNYFKNGVAFLRDQLIKNASDPIVVSRNGQTLYTGESVVAKSEFEDVDREGRRVNVYIVDFLIPGASGYEPERGDLVVYNGGAYSVRPLGREIWRWDDPYKEMMRVHAQLIGETT
ncbi:MAG: hypothetical protein IJU03_08185 [Thermoguttaceae bacterium]|nr:hypothetical protein [Thermoguttaceae bacterium]